MFFSISAPLFFSPFSSFSIFPPCIRPFFRSNSNPAKGNQPPRLPLPTIVFSTILYNILDLLVIQMVFFSLRFPGAAFDAALFVQNLGHFPRLVRKSCDWLRRLKLQSFMANAQQW